MTEKEEFIEFFNKHPDLDNTEYYAEFPEANKSTIRSWKASLIKERSPPETTKPTPPPSNKKVEGNPELEEEYIKLLVQQTRTDPREIEGLDNKSKILILKNRLEMTPKARSPNSPILPQPLPESQTRKRFGIDEFIEFDKNEIRMQIPMDHILDPEKNKKLGLLN